MTLGLGLGLPFARSASSAAPSFDPADLFGDSEFGWLYEPGRDGGAFANSNGTGALTADGDPTGYVTDFSGNGFHQLQATTAYKAPLRIAGGIWSVEVNYGGASPKFLEAELGSWTLTAPFTQVMVVRTGTDAWGPTIVSQGGNYVDALFHYPNEIRLGTRLGTGISDHDYSLTYSSVHTLLWAMIHNTGDANNEEHILDGVTSMHTRGSFGNIIDGTAKVGMGGSYGGSAGQEGHVAFAMFIQRLLTAQEKTDLLAYLTKFSGWTG